MARSVNRFDICLMMLGASILAAGLGTSSAYAISDTWQDPQGLEIVFDETSNSSSAPQAPQDLHATTSSNSVTLTWEEPDNPDIVGYDILRKTIQSDRHFRIIHFWNGTVDTNTTFVDTNVIPGLKFAYRVATVMSDGSFAESKSVRVKVQPRVPENLDAVATPGSVTLTWDDPDDQNIIGYNILRKPTKHNEVFQLIRTIGDTSVTSFVDTDVTRGIKYAYRVEPSAAHGDYARSEVVRIAVPPKLPENLGAAATSDSVTLTWDEPDDQDIIGYKILRKRGMHNEPLAVIHIFNGTSGTNNTFVDADVTTGIKYVYVVLPFSSEGTYARSESVKITVPPKLPENLRANATSDSVTLTWDDPDDPNIIGYNILRRATAEQSKLSVIAGGIGNTSNTFVDYNVTADTRYAYRVMALGAEGEYARSGSISIKTPPHTLLPITLFAPEGLEAAPTTGSVTLTWENPPYDITGYKIFRKTADSPSAAPVYVEDTRRADTVFTDTNVTVGQTYMYRIAAISAAGESEKSNYTSIFVPMPAPQNLAATATSDNVTLTWDDPGHEGITGYKIFRGVYYFDTPISDYAVTQNADTVFVDHNVTSGVSYIYRIAAIGAAGESTKSNFFRTYVLIPQLQNLTATATSDNVTLTWADPGDENITGYSISRYIPNLFRAPVYWYLGPDINNTFVDTDITEGTTYSYRVVAKYAPSGSPGRGYVTVQVPPSAAPENIPIPAPVWQPRVYAPPQDLHAMATTNSVTLTWEEPDNPSIVGYDIRRRSPTWGSISTIIHFWNSTVNTDTTFVDTDITPGIVYIYTVSSVASDGTYAGSKHVRVRAVPVIPENLTITATSDSVTLTWDELDDHDIIGYKILRKAPKHDRSFETIHVLNDTSNPNNMFVDTNVIQGVKYVYRLVPFSAQDDYPRSVVAKIIVPPRVPENLSATTTSDYVTLTWDESDGQDITTYLVMRKVNKHYFEPIHILTNSSLGDYGSNLRAPGGGFWLGIGSSSAQRASLFPESPIGNAFVDTDVIPGVKYKYHILAYGSHGYYERSETVRVVVPPRLPENLTATATTDSVTLTWDDPDDQNIIGYKILRKATAEQTRFEVLVEDIRNTGNTFVDHDVAADTRYTYRVAAFSTQGEYARSEDVSIRTPSSVLPPITLFVPEGLNATATPGSVTLTWDNPPYDDIAGYKIFRKTADLPSAAPVYVEDTRRADTVFTDTNVTVGQTYMYRIAAISAAGESEKSNYTRIHVPLPVPEILDVTAASGSVILTWDDPGYNGITGYKVFRRTNDLTMSESNSTAPASDYIVDTKNTDTTFVDRDAAPGAVSIYRVASVGATGESARSDFVRIGVPIPALQNLTATATSDNVTLVWDDQGDGGIVGYDILRREASDEHFIVVRPWNSTSGINSTFVDTDVTAGATYTYHVMAVNTAAGVERSGAITIQVPPSGPPENNNATAPVPQSPPLAPNIFVNTTEDTPVTVTSRTFIITAVTNGTNGTAVHNGTEITYIPDSDYNGYDTINYTVTDDEGQTATGSIYITITPVNDPPVLYSPLYMNVTAGDSINFTVTATDPDNDPLVFNLTHAPTGAEITQDGVFSYTSDSDDDANYLIGILVSDPDGEFSLEVTFLHVINPNSTSSNDPPAPVLPTIVLPPEYEDVIIIPENQRFAFDIGVTGFNDTRYLNFTLDPPVAGARITQEGVFSWTPTERDGPGTHTFTIVVSDGTYSTSRAVTFIVVEMNQAPEITGYQSAQILAQRAAVGETLVFNVTAYDADIPEQTLTFNTTGQPAGMTNSVWNSSGWADSVFRWTPGASQTGEHAITITVTDEHGATASKNITIYVTDQSAGINQPSANYSLPTAPDISVTTTEDTPVTVTPEILYPDGDFAINITKQGTKGRAVEANTTIIYRPNSGVTGIDTVSYVIATVDGISNEANITITIGAEQANTPPVFNRYPPNMIVTAGYHLAFAVWANDTDGDPLTFHLAQAPAGATITKTTEHYRYLETATFEWVTDDDDIGNHTVVITISDGTQTSSLPIIIAVTASNLASANDTSVPVPQSPPYIPYTGYNGYDMIYMVANDEGVEPDIYVNAIEDTPVNILLDVPNQDITRITAVTDGRFNIFAAGEAVAIYYHLDRFRDRHDTKNYTVTNGISHISTTGPAAITYTPDLDYNGHDMINYTITNDKNQTVTGTIVINVTPVNDQPEFLYAPYYMSVDTIFDLNFTVWANDVDGDDLVFNITDAPAPVTWYSYYNATNYTVATFTWEPPFLHMGDHAFNITVSDGQGGTDSQPVVLNVTNPDLVYPYGQPTIGLPSEYEDVGFIIIPEDQRFTLDINVTGLDDAGYVLYFTVDPPVTGARITQEGRFSWTPTERDGPGTYTFNITASDDTYLVSRAVTFIVVEENQAPVLGYIEDLVAFAGQTLTFDMSATDVDNQELIFNMTGAPAGATIDHASGIFSWTPTASQTGIHIITLSVTDGQGGTDSQTIVLTVIDSNLTPPNNPPVSAPHQPSAAPDIFVNTTVNTLITVTPEISDPDFGAATIVFVSAVLPGSATTDGTSVQYVPEPDYSGPAVIGYIVANGEGRTAAGFIFITIAPVNDAPPVALDAIVNTDEFGDVLVDLVAEGHATDDNPDTVTAEVLAQGTKGYATAFGSSIYYQSYVGATGIDTIHYGITDSGGLEDSARIYIVLPEAGTNRPPTAENFVIDTVSGRTVWIDMFEEGHINDDDPATLFAYVSIQPTRGSAYIHGTTMIYSVDEGQAGLDVFGYTVVDAGGEAASALVAVWITDNMPPVAANIDLGVEAGRAIDVDLLQDGHITDDSPETLDARILAAPSLGNATISPDAVLRYESDANRTGLDVFSYIVTDVHGSTDTGLVTVSVLPESNAAPAGRDIDIRASPGKTVHRDISGIVRDPDGGTVTVGILRPPSQGVASASGMTITYTANENATGTDSFDYLLIDNYGAFTSWTVSVTVAEPRVPGAPDQPPTADDFTVHTDRTGAARVDLAGTGHVTDDDISTVTVAILEQGRKGMALVIDGGVIIYQANLGESGTDTVRYRVTDLAGASANGTMTVILQQSVTPPSASGFKIEAVPGQTVEVDLLEEGYISDDSPGTLTVSITIQPALGAASIVGNTTLRYQADANGEGLSALEYMVTDQDGENATATVSVSVTAPQLEVAPTAKSISIPTARGQDTQVDLLRGGYVADDDLDELVASIVVQPKLGRATVVDNTTIRYQADETREGLDVFAYTVTDPDGGNATGVVTVSVLPESNMPPAGRDIVIAVAPGRTVIEDISGVINDPEGNDVIAAILRQPAQGNASAIGTIISYTARQNAAGTDSFSYILVDEFGAASTWNVTVAITGTSGTGRPPVSSEPVKPAAHVAPDILINAEIYFPSIVTPVVTGADGDNTTITEVTGSTLGILDTSMLPQISYTPNQTGIDTIHYTVSDGSGRTDTGTITIFINPEGNAKPVLDHIYNIGGRVGVDLEFTATADDSDDTSFTFDIANAPDGANITAGGDFSWTPTSSQNGTHTVTFIVHDNRGGADWQHVVVTVLSENETNLPPIPEDIVATAVLGGGRGFQPDIVDPENDVTEITRVYDSSLGDLDRSFLSQGIIVYVAGVLGNDEVIYTVSDGRGGFTNGTISITVEEPANVRPIIKFVGDKGVNAGDELTFTVDAEDLDGFVTGFELQGDTQGPSMSPLGVFSWTPTANDVGRHEFTILVFDDAGDNSTVSITVTVRPSDFENSPPVAPDVVIMTSQDVLSIVRPTIADPDEGDPVQISQIGDTTKGRILTGFLRAGIIIYLPDQGESGTETISYTVSDSSGDTDTADINVFISARGNTDPILGSIDFRNINAGDPLGFDLEADDPDGDTISYLPVGAPDSIEISSQGRLSWTPTEDNVGSHTFTVIAYDDRGGADSKTAVVRVLPEANVNQPPVAPSSTVTVAPGGSFVITPEVSDPDGDRVVITDAVTDGTGVVIPSPDSMNYVHVSTAPTETITYTVTDARGATATGTITVTVQ